MLRKSPYKALKHGHGRGRSGSAVDPVADPPTILGDDLPTESSVSMDPSAFATDVSSSASAFDSFGTGLSFKPHEQHEDAEEDDFGSCAAFDDFDLPPDYFDVISTLNSSGAPRGQAPSSELDQDQGFHECTLLHSAPTLIPSACPTPGKPLLGVKMMPRFQHRRVSDATCATASETECSPSTQSRSSSPSEATPEDDPNQQRAELDNRSMHSNLETHSPNTPVSAIVSSIQVAVRIRPLLESELILDRNVTRSTTTPKPWTIRRSADGPSSTVSLELQQCPHSSTGGAAYCLDQVFDETASTRDIHARVTRPLVHAVIEGRHATILAYGQTGSGKTHTMQGSNAIDAQGRHRAGIVELAATDMFRHIQSPGSKRKYSVKAQYFEIYNEQIRDLLQVHGLSLLDASDWRKEGQVMTTVDDSNENELDVNDDDTVSLNAEFARSNSRGSNNSFSSNRSVGRRFGGRRARPSNRNTRQLSPRRFLRHVVSKGATAKQHPSQNHVLQVREADGQPIVTAVAMEVFSVDDVLQLLEEGAQNRAVGTTNANEHSSRSHAIFRFTVESYEPETTGAAKLVSVLNLVDLAGSENAHRSGTTGLRRRESGAINQSLLTLSRVIHSLSLPEKKRPKHINYRDSKLTRILQPHLSGNAGLAFLCCVSPSWDKVVETRSTLKFATSAKHVKTKPVVNEVVDYREMVQTLQCELVEAKQELRRLHCFFIAEASPDLTEPAKGNLEHALYHSEWTSSPGLIGAAFDAADSLRVEWPNRKASDVTEKARRNVLVESTPKCFKECAFQTSLFSDLSEFEPMRHPIQEVVVVDEKGSKAPLAPTNQSIRECSGVELGSFCSRLRDSDARAQFLEEKLSATDKLVETLFRDLEASNRSNAELQAQVDFWKDQASNLEVPRSTDVDLNRARLMKTAFYSAAAFYVTSQQDLFLAAVTFLWLSLESSTRATTSSSR